jgi:hypothetical protein
VVEIGFSGYVSDCRNVQRKQGWNKLLGDVADVMIIDG